MSPIKHVVILFKENHTFDNYFGTFPGVDGMSNLPHAANPPKSDHPHDHAAWIKRETTAIREQYHASDIPAYFSYAKQFTLCDKYFTDVAGPSFPNHLMVIAADSPIIDNSHISDAVTRKQPVPPFAIPSLPKQLEEKKMDWRNYGGLAFRLIKDLILSPKNVSSDQFVKDAMNGNLPEVSWVFPPEGKSEHPTEDITVGETWTVQQVNAIIKGGLWDSTAIFITWDDWGGWYDHVTPPEVEKWKDGTQFRFGSRVGCIVLSPFAKKNYVSKIQQSHVSIVGFCEEIFGLPSLNNRTKTSNKMMDCFDFSQTPLAPPK